MTTISEYIKHIGKIEIKQGEDWEFRCNGKNAIGGKFKKGRML